MRGGALWLSWIIDSQSVKGATPSDATAVVTTPARRSTAGSGFIVTDTLGLLIVVVVLAASVQDRDGAKTTLLSAYLISPIRFVFADGGFAGKLVDWARTILVRWAAINTMTSRIARGEPATRQRRWHCPTNHDGVSNTR